jgi:hypothetical protein
MAKTEEVIVTTNPVDIPKINETTVNISKYQKGKITRADPYLIVP